MKNVRSQYKYHFLLIFLLLAGGILLFKVNSSIEQKDLDKRQIKLEAVHQDALNRLETKVDNFATLTAGIGSFIKYSDSLPSDQELMKFCGHLVAQIDYQDSLLVSLLNTEHDFIASFSLTQNNPAGLVGSNVSQFRSERELKLLDEAVLKENILMFEPFNLVEGWAGISMNFGIKRNGKAIGYVSPIINLNYILEGIYEGNSAKDFVFKFSTSQGYYFDRFAVYDGSEIMTDNIDPEYFEKVESKESEYISSTINLYGYPITVQTAYKNPVSELSTIVITMYVWFAFMVFFILFTVWQLSRSTKLTKRLMSARKELEQLSIVASETNNIILILDFKGDLMWVNRAFEELNNLTYQELIAERGKNIRTISNSKKMVEILDECEKIEKPIQYDSLNITNEGKRVWESSTITPIYKEGKLTNFIIIDTDITELKLAEEEIKLKNVELTRLSIVAEKMNEAVIITDANGKIEYYNASMVRNSGFSIEEFEEFIHEKHDIFAMSSRDDLQDIFQGFHSNPTAHIYDSSHTMKNGDQMWTTASMSPVYDEEEILRNVIVVYTDINERKKQREQLETRNREIMDSIVYAKRLQNTILPSMEFIQACFKDNFILYQPKDVVAGDFYWFEKIGDTIYFAAADCTGHGVPGAMVSVVCFIALTKALIEEEIAMPSEILDRTRELVIERFEKGGSNLKDGMDISLCALNTKTLELQYAGANNPLWIVPKNSEELNEIKGDKQPIGSFEGAKPFLNHTLSLKKGDTLYLSTDGFQDQFGGDRGKKYKSARFKEYLFSISQKSLNEQGNLIKEEFKNWTGDLEQLDDVCVIGIRL
jgi:PAS domain S-box-containing protein